MYLTCCDVPHVRCHEATNTYAFRSMVGPVACSEYLPVHSITMDLNSGLDNYGLKKVLTQLDIIRHVCFICSNICSRKKLREMA